MSSDDLPIVVENEEQPEDSTFGSYTSYLVNWISGSLTAAPSPVADNNLIIPRSKSPSRHMSFDESMMDRLPTITLKNRLEKTRKVLNLLIAESLRNYLPTYFEISSSWELLYSLDQHGSSLQTLYRSMDKYEEDKMRHGFVLICKDSSDEKFGAFFTSPLKIQKHCYGTGECFLFSIDDNENPIIYKATGKNDYYILSQSNLLAFGSGGGFGLCFNDTFSDCMTSKSETFDNMPYFIFT
eukprot:NODE_195_length_13287_cov_0.482484.p8 type:complete len:240 gc:universal NODE_195_length_13287_cov_0.482484:1116-397(-)